MRNIHYADHLEKQIAEVLDSLGIDFVHESEDKYQELDFWLPRHDVYIEVKQFHASRIEKQMASRSNVIVLQGRKSVELFKTLLTK